MADHFVVSNDALDQLAALDPGLVGKRVQAQYEVERTPDSKNFVSVVPPFAPQPEDGVR